MKLCVECIKCAPQLRNSWSCRLQPAVLSPTAVWSNLKQLLDRPWIHLNIFHNYFSSLQNIFTIYLVICFSVNICYCRFWLFCRNQELLGHTHHILFQLLNRIKNNFASSQIKASTYDIKCCKNVEIMSQPTGDHILSKFQY